MPQHCFRTSRVALTRCTSKNQGGNPSRSAEIWTRNRRPVLPTPPKKHQKDTKPTGDVQNCSLLCYSHHNWSRMLLPVLIPQWLWGPAEVHRAHCPCPSPQRIISKQRDPSPKHHHPIWSSPTTTAFPMKEAAHITPAPAAPSPSNHHPKSICPGQQLWPPPAQDKEVSCAQMTSMLHHCKDIALCKHKWSLPI